MRADDTDDATVPVDAESRRSNIVKVTAVCGPDGRSTAWPMQLAYIIESPDR